MEQKKPISHILAGVIIGIALVLFTVITYFAGVTESGIMGWVPVLILVGGLIAFVYIYGNTMNNEVSFGNLFSYGFKATAVVALIVIFCTAIFILLTPEVREQSFEAARKKMIEQRKLSSDDIERSLEIARKWYWVLTIGGIMLLYAIQGAIGSVIGAAITKKKPVNPTNQLNF
jgi:Protein of unknown function (DUF4199)